ncbi:uL15 family ribosomal protein [Candidatus Woesearchaeota archaeon]|nr:uL15 family ribosomal protein [Candidatus Woesearchaeota archaeon]
MQTKRSKNSRQRGSKTHSWGAMKKHRGAGNRGGRGNAGTGKRGDANKPSIWKDKKYFGKHGMKSRFKVVKAINIQKLNQMADELCTKKGDVYTVDLSKVKIGKLLSVGTPAYKYDITVNTASQKAIDKIVQKGGKVTLNEPDDDFEDSEEDNNDEVVSEDNETADDKADSAN